MSLSLAEILVILLIAILVAKPSDISFIIKKIRQIKKTINSYQTSLNNFIENQFEDIETNLSIEDKNNINYFLKKIIDLKGKYEGKYDIESIKKEYEKIKQECKKEQD